MLERLQSFLKSKLAKSIIFIPPALFILSGLSRAIFSFTLKDPSPFFNSTAFKVYFYSVCGLIVIMGLVVELIIYSQKDNIDWKLFRLTYIGALSITFGLLVIFSHGWVDDITNSPWNSYYIAPDSEGYVVPYHIESIRTPVYPYFIDITTLGTPFDHMIGTRPLNQMITPSAVDDPLLRTVQIQKIFLLLSVILLTIVLVDCFHSLLPFTLALFIYDFNFLTYYKSYILTEALAQALMFLIVAGLFLFIFKKYRWTLIAAGVLSATAYLARPASAYTSLIFIGIALWAVFTQFNHKKWYLISAFCLWGIILFSYMFLIHLNSGKWSVSPISYLTRMGSALMVTTPQDINLMPDQDLKQYYQVLQQKIDQLGFKSKTDIHDRMLEYTNNIYQIAIPAASEVIKNGNHYDANTLMEKTSTIILLNHPKEYAQMVLNFIGYSINESRFSKTGGLILILGLVILFAIFLKNKTAFCALALILTHVMNIVMTSAIEIPDDRYLFMTEALVLIALVILCMEYLIKINDRISKPSL